MGRLVPEKRVEDLIAAFRPIARAFRLAIVGKGGYTGRYVDHLRGLAADDPRIVFTGLFAPRRTYQTPPPGQGLGAPFK